MKRLILPAIICALVVAACQLPKDTAPLSRCWKLQEARNEEYLQNRTDKSSLMLDSVCKRFAMGYLSLYDDNKYVFLGKFTNSMGSWKYDKSQDKIVLLRFMDNTDVSFTLKGSAEKWMVLIPSAYGKLLLDNADVTLMFEHDPHFEYANTDLISYENNDWRVAPSHRENRAEIKARVKKHVDFLTEYYKLCENRNRTYFEPIYLQSAVRFCRDGVGVESAEHLTDKWISCFYDREDALKGRQILEDAVAASGKWPEDQKLMDAYLTVVTKMREYMERS